MLSWIVYPLWLLLFAPLPSKGKGVESYAMTQALVADSAAAYEQPKLETSFLSARIPSRGHSLKKSMKEGLLICSSSIITSIFTTFSSELKILPTSRGFRPGFYEFISLLRLF